MRTIAILNLKGGVGKTTTAVNMASILAERGYRCVVIDADPQANATQFFGIDGEECNTTTDMLLPTYIGGDVDDFLYATATAGVQIIPADFGLVDVDIASIRGENRTIVKRFKDVVDTLNDDDMTDFVIVDCPPSFTAASIAAIYAADDIIIPVKIDAFSMAGMKQLTKQIHSVQNIRPQIRIAGALITMWHNSPAVVQGEQLLRESRVPVFHTVIRRSDKVDEASFMRLPLGTYSSRSSAAKDYESFVTEYLEEVAI